MSRKSLIAGLGLLVALARPANPQEAPKAPGPTPTFPARVEPVTVDVVVTGEELSRTWLPIVREVELGSGRHRAKMVVRDEVTGRMGTLMSSLEDASPGEDQLVLRFKDEFSGSRLELREPFRVSAPLPAPPAPGGS